MSEMSNTCRAVLRHTATRLRLSLTESTAVRKLTSQMEWSFFVFQRHSRRGLFFFPGPFRQNFVRDKRGSWKGVCELEFREFHTKDLY